MSKKIYPAAVKQILQNVGLAADSIISDCSIHYSKKAGDSDRNMVAYVAYFGEKFMFLWMCKKHEGYIGRYLSLNVKTAKKDEMESFRKCSDAVDEFVESMKRN